MVLLLKLQIVMAFVQEIEQTCQIKLRTIDIGGGLSTSYTDAAEPQGFEYKTYRKMLDDAVPQLFSGQYQVFTHVRNIYTKVNFKSHSQESSLLSSIKAAI